MKRTIATKMIVMSNEFKTRGSMPGAMRSEIIWRSSAGAEAAIHHLRVEERRRKINPEQRFCPGGGRDPAQELAENVDGLGHRGLAGERLCLAEACSREPGCTCH